MKIFKKYIFETQSEDERFRVETILDQFNIEYEYFGEIGEGFIETYSECPDECLDMLNHCI